MVMEYKKKKNFVTASTTTTPEGKIIVPPILQVK
jgi:hypothetical protein